MKYLLLALVGFVAYLFWKKLNAPHVRVRPAPPPPARAVVRAALDDAQQQLFQRLQSTLPSVMILVQPALVQILDLGADTSRYTDVLVDFAICRKDSTPLAIIVLDDSLADPAMAQIVEASGVRFVRFHRARLPDAARIKEVLGFL